MSTQNKQEELKKNILGFLEDSQGEFNFESPDEAADFLADWILDREQSLKSEIRERLLKEGPKDKEYRKLEKCWMCKGYQFSCCCGDAFDEANEQWKEAIRKVIGGGDG